MSARNHDPRPSPGTLYIGRRDWSVEKLCEMQQDATESSECFCAVIKLGWEAGYKDAVWMLREASKALRGES